MAWYQPVNLVFLRNGVLACRFLNDKSNLDFLPELILAFFLADGRCSCICSQHTTNIWRSFERRHEFPETRIMKRLALANRASLGRPSDRRIKALLVDFCRRGEHSRAMGSSEIGVRAEPQMHSFLLQRLTSRHAWANECWGIRKSNFRLHLYANSCSWSS